MASDTWKLHGVMILLLNVSKVDSNLQNINFFYANFLISMLHSSFEYYLLLLQTLVKHLANISQTFDKY